MTVKELYDGALYVELTADEIAIQTLVGKARNFRAEIKGRDPNYRGLDDRIEDGMTQEQLHIHGVGGELAAAKGLGIYPSSLGELYEDDNDVAGIQVRCRTSHQYELYLYPDDPGDKPWLLVTNEVPGLYVLQGHLFGNYCKDMKYYRRAHRNFPRINSFVVPQHHLSQDWDSLIEWANDYRKFNLIGRRATVNT